tara:strand:- start:197797 stop:197898 length:102 start_codon:yes stop_codon:yes gene_type:complete
VIPDFGYLEADSEPPQIPGGKAGKKLVELLTSM